MVFIFHVGKEGPSGGSLEVAAFFGIGKGSVNNYIRRTVKALLEIKKETVYWWPDIQERESMRKRLGVKGFWHCVGIIDGT